MWVQCPLGEFGFAMPPVSTGILPPRRETGNKSIVAERIILHFFFCCYGAPQLLGGMTVR
jgi:hypothetical protein